MKKTIIKNASEILTIPRTETHFLLGYMSTLFVLAIALLITTPKLLTMIDQTAYAYKEPVFPKLPLTTTQAAVAGVQKRPPLIVDHHITPPNFTAVGVLAQDLDSGVVLYQKNVDMQLAPASTTKIMTALTALDYYKFTDILTVPQSAMVGGSTMGLVPNEKITFRNLLYGLLLNSGNDAAFTIAANYPGGISQFVNKMNQKAADFQLNNTHFQNPAGFDNPTHYSSAFDLAVISKVAASNTILSPIFGTKEAVVYSVDNSRIHRLENVNKLLGQDGIIGIKTGYTEKAGENLVGLVDRNNRKILTVVLGSTDRFDETKALMDWIYQDFSWEDR